MSNHLFGHYRRSDDSNPKNLTPKGSKYSPKISPVFSSVRSGMMLKQDISKGKIIKPATAKNMNDSNSGQYFHAKDNVSRKPYSSSNKKLELTSKSAIKRSFEYQPRSKSKSPIKHQEEIIREEIFTQPKSFIPTDRGIRVMENDHSPLPKLLLPISNFEPAKFSNKPNGNIKAFAASTNQGPVREYNEDRVAIILTIPKPKNYVDWKKAAYFGVFDGHGGMDCADFLRDNLHLFISREKNFPNKMEESIWNGFEKCEKTFLDQSYSGKLDRSGSCGIIAFFYGQQCYISNVGDSRAIMSSKEGKIIKELSLDHKASDEFEQKRIIDNNGRIYQTKLRNANPNAKIFYEGEDRDFVMGPHRAFPGRLSVSRTFGDIEAKLPEFGGNPKAIICTPEIRVLTLSEDDDFIILGCDGIFDKMSNSEVIDVVWDTFRRDKGSFQTLHEFCGKAVQNIMKLSFYKKTLDNVTVVMIALEGLERHFNSLELKWAAETSLVEPKKSKPTYKMQYSFERKYVGRSVSPTNYSSVRAKSFYGKP